MFTPQRKHFLTVFAALAVAGLVLAAVTAVTAGKPADLGTLGARPPQLHIASKVEHAAAGVLEESAPVQQVPVITLPSDGPGIAANTVGEHPDLTPSPNHGVTVIEPVFEHLLLLGDGEHAECQEFRSLIADGRDWDADVVLAMAWRESRCDARLVSVTNDWGLLQLNATCWAGTAIDGLPDVRSLPSSVAPADIRCDGVTQSTTTAQWCYRAKEAKYDTGDLPSSPCDAWLDPSVNLETAYALWERFGWRPWCFSDEMRATYACRAAEESL